MNDVSFCNLTATVSPVIDTREPRIGATLRVLAAVGRVCGPVSDLRYLGQSGALALVSVKPLRGIDPVLALPLVEATSAAWDVYRAYYHAVLDTLSAISLRRAAAHHAAAELVPQVAAAFAPHLGAKAAEFEFWLWATLTGEARG